MLHGCCTPLAFASLENSPLNSEGQHLQLDILAASFFFCCYFVLFFLSHYFVNTLCRFAVAYTQFLLRCLLIVSWGFPCTYRVFLFVSLFFLLLLLDSLLVFNLKVYLCLSDGSLWIVTWNTAGFLYLGVCILPQVWEVWSCCFFHMFSAPFSMSSPLGPLLCECWWAWCALKLFLILFSFCFSDWVSYPRKD